MDLDSFWQHCVSRNDSYACIPLYNAYGQSYFKLSVDIRLVVLSGVLCHAR